MDIFLNILILGFTISLTVIPITGDLLVKQKRRNNLLLRGYTFIVVAFFALLCGIIQVIRSTKDQKVRDNAQSLILDNTKQITGGDSYCRMGVGITVDNRDIGYLDFHVEGKYQLSNVKIRIVDLNDPDSEIKTTSDIFKNTFNLGTISPNMAALTTQTIYLDKIKGVNMVIFFSANNGFTNQTFKMRFVNGKWSTATRITSFEGDKELYLNIDPDYPEKNKEIIFR